LATGIDGGSTDGISDVVVRIFPNTFPKETFLPLPLRESSRKQRPSPFGKVLALWGNLIRYRKGVNVMPANASEKPATVEDSLHEVPKVRSRVTDAVEDGVRSASQAIRHGRHAAEDAIAEAKHTVKRRPLQAMGTFFAAGVLAGTVFTLIGSRRR
jgi:ElaB/YqjD/DUF883 family membrane-anchored ribosome-binding protein